MCVCALVHCIRVCNYDGEWYVQLGDIGMHTCGTRSIVCVCVFVCLRCDFRRCTAVVRNQVFLSGHLNRSLSSQVSLRKVELRYVHTYLHAHIHCAVSLGCWSL